ncbi:conserved protein of unknown function [Moritella yayanosii]|uniref:DUF4250 domain-containing protein n=2 Tax=Moritellaceae TaxID=267891 RepID=A0A330LNT6_9GAMM|nr:conserved protein of unknown function [Moritella yayanosii]
MKMDLSNFEQMDTAILLGIVNEKLRLECPDLHDLSACYEMPTEALANKLYTLGYHYDTKTNQFKNF